MMMESEEDRMEAQQAEDLLDSDSRHELQLGLDFLPCPSTVIVGRGKKVAQHPGNVRFRELVKQELTEYSAATTKAHKSSIILRVLTDIRNKSHHAFVKQNLTTGRWYRVEETAQRITTAQAFRDALKDNYKSSRAFKKLKREEEKAASNTDEKVKEKKEKKKAAAKEKKKAKPKQAPKPVPTPAASAAAPAEAGLTKSTSGGGNGKSMEDLRAMLEQQQTALVSGNFSWWDPKAVTTTSTATTAMEEDKKMPPPSAIPSTSVSSCSSLLWSNHSKFSDFGGGVKKDNKKSSSRDYNMSGHNNSIKWSNHSIRTMSNHSIMTISGHSARSNSTFNGLVSKYAPNGNADMQGNPFEPTPIPSCVMEDGGAMDMEMDDVDDDQGGEHRKPKSYVPRSGTTFDEGIAMGLGNLSDHSLMSNMSSLHSVKGYTPEEIFADTSMHGNNNNGGGNNRDNNNNQNGGRGSQNQQQQQRNGYPGGRYRHINFSTMSA